MNRIFGLDLIRCFAIVSVLICHTMVFFYPFTSGFGEILFNLISWSAGFYGVEIFFVLSGFLIGNIFIKNVVFNNLESNQKLLLSNFWMRRWVRTLPNYFLFLLINILLIPIAPETTINLQTFSKYLIFIQYITPNPSSFFGISWSLAVEEWFYILLPILFVGALVLMKNRKRAFLAAMFLLLLIPSLLKIFYAVQLPLYSDTESVFHYSTFYKLDSIFYGLLLAWLWNNEDAHKWLIRRKNALLYVGMSGILFSFIFAFLFVVKPIQNSILMILFSPITSISIGLVFPFLYEWRVKNNRFTQSVTFISLISYSLYLVHVPLINIYKSLSKTLSLHSDFITSFAAFILLNASSIFIAYIIYKKFETPTLQYREKFEKLLASRNVKS
jgi:peptidoglycan/LPS O-acetylase OafA/YrhL